MVSGLGEDTFIDKSEVLEEAKRVIYYDTKRKTTGGTRAGIRRQILKRPQIYTYNRRTIDHSFNYFSTLPSIGFNPDDGLWGLFDNIPPLVLKIADSRPSTTLKASYALATSGFSIEYSSEFIDLFGKWEFSLDALVQTRCIRSTSTV